MGKVNSFLVTSRKHALIYATGGIAALQSLRMEIFSFPPVVRLYLGYSLSIITVICIFFAGEMVIDWIKKINEMVGKIKEMDAKKADSEKQ